MVYGNTGDATFVLNERGIAATQLARVRTQLKGCRSGSKQHGELLAKEKKLVGEIKFYNEVLAKHDVAMKTYLVAYAAHQKRPSVRFKRWLRRLFDRLYGC